MANITVNLNYPISDGEKISFRAPCDCTEITGLLVRYPSVTDIDVTSTSKVFAFKDAHGNDLTGIGNLFSAGAFISVLLDVTNGAAYIQNADTNAYIEGAFAPSGYGLGEESKNCADCNLVTGNGFYRFSGENCANYPDRVANFKYGAMVQFTRKTNATSKTAYQIAAYSGNYAMRHGDATAGTWNDWEYLNPPLLSGAEYKTTERYDGKAVYTKRVDVGAAPNATTKTISIGASGANIISCDAFLYKDTTFSSLPSYDADTLRAYHWCSNGSLSIKTLKDLSSYNCCAIVKYTKD